MADGPAPEGPRARRFPAARRWWDQQHEPYRRLLLTQVFHGAGDALVAIALAGTLFFDVPIGEARDKVGLYLLITMAPYAVLSPVVGPLLDRWRDSYRIAIIVGAVGRAVLAVLMASRTDTLVLYPMAFGVLVLSRAHAVSRAALVPAVVPPGRTLLWVNGRLAIATLGGGALGAIPGAALQSVASAWPVLWLAAVVFAGAAIAAGILPRPDGGVERRSVTRGEHRDLPSHLLAAGTAGTALRGVVGYLTFFLAFALRGVGEGGGAFGMAVVAAGLGGLLGSLAAPLVGRVLRGAGPLLVALVAIGIAAVAAVPGFGAERAAMVGAVTGLAAALGRHGFDSIVQSDAGEHVRGRAFARYETTFQLAWVAGAGLATIVPFASGPGLRTAAVICFGGILATVATGLRARGG